MDGWKCWKYKQKSAYSVISSLNPWSVENTTRNLRIVISSLNPRLVENATRNLLIVFSLFWTHGRLKKCKEISAYSAISSLNPRMVEITNRNQLITLSLLWIHERLKIQTDHLKRQKSNNKQSGNTILRNISNYHLLLLTVIGVRTFRSRPNCLIVTAVWPFKTSQHHEVKRNTF